MQAGSISSSELSYWWIGKMGFTWKQLGPVVFAKYTTAERDAVSDPPAYLVLYNTTLQKLELFDNIDWQEFLTYFGTATSEEIAVWNATESYWEPKSPAEYLAMLSGEATAAFDMNSQKITGLAAGAASNEAVEYDQLHAEDHKARHTDGSDDIQDATSGQKGVATAAQITKLDAIEAAADVTDATNVNAAGATMNADTDVSANGYVLDEDNMASDDATKVPTQQSVKAYVDAGGGGGATTALDNLASVAINTSLLSDADSTDDLGSATKRWKRTYTDGLLLEPDSELTLDANGEITVVNSKAYYQVDTFEDAATDNLDGINGGVDGAILVLHAVSLNRVVTVRHNQNSEAGNNIFLANAQPFVTRNALRDILVLIFELGVNVNGAWIEISRSAQLPLFASALVPGAVAVGTEPPHVPAFYAGVATEIYARYTSGSADACTFTIHHYNQAGVEQNTQQVEMGNAVFKVEDGLAWAITKNDYFYIVIDTIGGGTPVDLLWQVRP